MLFLDQIKRGDPKLRIISRGVAAGLVLLLACLWYVQIVSAKRYRADLLDQSFRIVRVPAIRGKILDRNGTPLAENRPSYNINLYLEELSRSFRQEYDTSVLPEFRLANPSFRGRPAGKAGQQLERAARFQVVSNFLGEVSSLVEQPQILDEREFNRHFNELRSLPFPLVRDLSAEQVALFMEKSAPISSLSLEVQPLRIYPWKSTAAHVLGHLRRNDNPADSEEISFHFRLPDYVGETGIERAFDQQLRGTPGVKTVLVNNLQYRQAEEVWIQPQPGDNVFLTIDRSIQIAAEQALKRGRPDPRGAVVVMDCRSADILALVSLPAFDPNFFTSRISEEDWARLRDEESRPLWNRATYGSYPAGSIFKIVVALAALEAGTINPNDIFESKGYFRIQGRSRPWRDTAGPGNFDFNRAFYRSSNPYFQHHGLKVGFEKVVEMGRRVGFGRRTGLATREEAQGYFPDPLDKIKKDGSPWMPGDTANLCIGQGDILVTPLQMAVMTAAVANRGSVLVPRLVDRIEPQDPEGPEQTVRFAPGQVRRDLGVSQSTLEIVRKAMLLDVDHMDGTGRSAAVEGLSVCGKTGTAQVMEGGALKEYVTWFVSFAPYDQPRYVVVVVVEGGQSGGSTCAPVAREIYQAILRRERGLTAAGDRIAAVKY
jgi:penicillin-binding protein 2